MGATLLQSISSTLSGEIAAMYHKGNPKNQRYKKTIIPLQILAGRKLIGHESALVSLATQSQ